MTDFKVGEQVMTPGGVGKLFEITEPMLVVEFDYERLVDYPVSKCTPIDANGVGVVRKEQGND
jgi:hypothetical protein